MLCPSAFHADLVSGILSDPNIIEGIYGAKLMLEVDWGLKYGFV